MSDANAPEPTKLGNVYLPKSGTGVGRFTFVVSLETGGDVVVGAPVVADTQEGAVLGMIVDMSTIGTDEDPVLTEAVRAGGTTSVMREVMIAECQVFGDSATRPITSGTVRVATADELATATGFHRNEWPIPAGCVDLIGGGRAPVYFDGTSLLGPEAAHCLISGLSGMASKTSYAGVLMRAAVACGDEDNHRVGILIVNVKGQDLLYMDEPPAAGYELQESDIALYDAMGIPATPFDNVTVYAPSEPGGSRTQSHREDANLLRWDLRTVFANLYQLAPQIYEDDKTAAFAATFNDQGFKAGIDTFDKLDAFFEGEIEQAEANKTDCWNNRFHPATFRKLRRMFAGLQTRGRGLFAKGLADRGDDIPDAGWSHGQVVVLDVAGLPTDVQGFAMSRTVQRLLDSAESGNLGVDHLIVFADELNTFAPSQGNEMAAVKKSLGLIAKQGRYAGVSLWGAAQKLSKIDETIRDQASTRAVGITVDAELATGVYGRLAGGLTERIATLPKGQMAVWHHLFRNVVLVAFPRPAWKTGKAKTSGAAHKGRRAFDSVVARAGLSSSAAQRLTEGLHPDDVDDLVVAADDPAKALEAIAAARVPDTSKALLIADAASSGTDPFAILDD